MVDSFAYWVIAIATIAGVAYIALAIFQRLRARHPDRLRLGERLPKAIATAEGLPNAREIQRDYCVTLLKKDAVYNLVIGAAIILASYLAFILSGPFQVAMTQISTMSGEDFNSFDTLYLFLFTSLAIVFIRICSSAGSLLATALLPVQRERQNDTLGYTVGWFSWRVVIVTLAPIIFLFAITLIYALSPTATHIYPPHIAAVTELHNRYPWIPFAIPFALIAGALMSGLSVWCLKRLALRRMVSDVTVSINADWSTRQDTAHHMVDGWQRLLYFPGFAQLMLLSQSYIPAFRGITSESLVVFLIPYLLWFAWCFFFAERLLRGPNTSVNAVTVPTR
jgi:hypothetical protein